MNSPKTKIINLLTDLKENHNAIGTKTELEDEGASFEEIRFFNEISNHAGLDLTLKIGGCGALNDIREAKRIGIKKLVAPMIESSYALKKYVQTIKNVFESKLPEIYINIETITGYKNFDEMFLTEESEILYGIVIGKCDMAKSMGLTCDDANCGKIFEVVSDILKKSEKYNKKVFIGGCISMDSINFFTRLPKNCFTGFETRKIIFDSTNINSESILKSINFEIQWIKYRQEQLNISRIDDDQRQIILQKRYNKLVSSSENLVLK